MKKYNLQGFIGLSYANTISNGDQWKKILTNSTLNKDIINTFIKKSCLDSYSFTSFSNYETRNCNQTLIDKEYVKLPSELFQRFFWCP